MALNNMPTELSMLVQDFIRPNPNKKKWDEVVKQMKYTGETFRLAGKDAGVWGDWVNETDEHEWDLMVCNCVAPAWIIAAEGDYIQEEFLGATISEQMLDQLWMSEEYNL